MTEDDSAKIFKHETRPRTWTLEINGKCVGHFNTKRLAELTLRLRNERARDRHKASHTVLQ